MGFFKCVLRTGNSATDAIFPSDFGSSNQAYRVSTHTIGAPSKRYEAADVAGEMIAYTCRHSALGLMMMAATDMGVCFVQFGDNQACLITQLKEEFPKAVFSASPLQKVPELDAWIKALNQYINQKTPIPDLPLEIRGTAFQIKLWQFLLGTREGDVLSYSDLATQTGNPKAFRAAASACAKNRISVLIPCHRVLRSDGSLGGYRWGLERKQALLDAERHRKVKYSHPTSMI